MFGLVVVRHLPGWERRGHNKPAATEAEFAVRVLPRLHHRDTGSEPPVRGVSVVQHPVLVQFIERVVAVRRVSSDLALFLYRNTGSGQLRFDTDSRRHIDARASLGFESGY